MAGAEPVRLARSGAAFGEAGPGAARSGFARFFAEEWPKLCAYLNRRVGPQKAEDLAQEAFIRVYDSSARVRSPSGLLYEAARNLVIDDHRRAVSTRRIVSETAMAEAIADPAPSPEERTHWRLRLERTQAMLERMSPKCRGVFLLRVVEDCSYAEIAARLGISVVAVEKQLLRAFEICAAWKGEDGARTRRGARAR